MITTSKEIKFTPRQIASVCDHTYLYPVEAYRNMSRSYESPIKIRQQAFYNFLQKTCNYKVKPYGVCVRTEDVPHARSHLDRNNCSNLTISAVIGFPDGSWVKSHYKFFQAQYALNEGAQEIDMPLNWQALRQGDHALVLEEIQKICRLVKNARGVFKLILETSLLDKFQIEQACKLASHAGVDFIKTSTGFGSSGVQSETLQLILKHFEGGIKISGGVNQSNVPLFLKMIMDARGDKKVLEPQKIRIGESELLDQLQEPESKG